MGVSKDQGCPIPDTDKDGVLDDVDNCPQEPGISSNGGCTPPAAMLDGDMDGVPDATDKCPKAAGLSVPRGCPRLTAFRPSDVTVYVGTARLTSAGRAELDKVTAYLTMFPNVTAELAGHTDNVDPIDANIGVSVRRAEAARDFLSAQGIALERLTIRGEGGLRPTTSNRTMEGRLMDRRIEVLLR